MYVLAALCLSIMMYNIFWRTRTFLAQPSPRWSLFKAAMTSTSATTINNPTASLLLQCEQDCFVQQELALTEIYLFHNTGWSCLIWQVFRSCGGSHGRVQPWHEGSSVYAMHCHCASNLVQIIYKCHILSELASHKGLHQLGHQSRLTVNRCFTCSLLQMHIFQKGTLLSSMLLSNDAAAELMKAKRSVAVLTRSDFGSKRDEHLCVSS